MIDAITLLLLLIIALAASLISIKVGISVAIIEIIVGIAVGNLIDIRPSEHEWLVFLAGLGSVVLTFLAGAEIDPDAMRKTWKTSLTIGILSFLAPFLSAWLFAYLILGWAWNASLIAGIALSTTSVAVVYIVLVEAGTSKTEVGKIILSSCFITDLGTAFALSVLFTGANLYLIALFVAMAICVLVVPRMLAWLLPLIKGRSGEPDVKVILVLVVLLGAIAEISGVQPVLPAYVLGLIVAKVLIGNREVLLKVRTIALAFLTPFFFINAGLNVSMVAVVSGSVLIALFFAVKVGAKFAGVLPATAKLVGKDSIYITLLMSTGLTFGTISAQYGLSSGLIDQSQFSVLLITVILTAIIPTIIAQKWYNPSGTGEGS